jgi:integrase
MSKRVKGDKPSKPYAAYPLHAHNSGQWAKRIRGKERYFGVWADPTAALNRYLAFINGIPLPNAIDTVGRRVDAFVAEKEAQHATGDIADETMREYKATCKVIADHYGRATPVENLEYNSLRIALSKGKRVKTLGPVTLKRRLIIARMIFHDRSESVRALKPPASKHLRAAKEAAGIKLYEAADLRKLIKAADNEFRWLLYLGINCAFGPKDCQHFPGPDGEWHNFARVKTGIGRRCWLWPETVKALKHQCEGWDRFNVAETFAALCESTGVVNHGFYSLRRTFVTVAVGTQPAVDRICGWAKGDMASIYRQKTFDDQIRAVAQSVRDWYLSAK